MSKVPCGGFELDKNFLGMNKNGELSLTVGAGEDKAYKQLVTDGEGNAKWLTMTLPVTFEATDATSSATIRCNFEYGELMWRLLTLNFGIMNGQLYIERTKSLFTMVGCTQKNTWLEFLFVAPMEGSNGLVLGSILKVYYLENGTLTFDAPDSPPA